MQLRQVRPGSARRGLRGLREVALGEGLQERLTRAVESSGGTAEWRARKLGEARDLLALSQVAPHRIEVQHLDLDQSLRAVVAMRVPVPCRNAGGTELTLAPSALLALTYRQEALVEPQPGFAFLQILAPGDVYHAQVHDGGVQALCLGAQLPPGVRVRELMLMAYGALSMQSVQLDTGDPAGVLNAPAAEWWLQNRDRIPLTATPFLGGS